MLGRYGTDRTVHRSNQGYKPKSVHILSRSFEFKGFDLKLFMPAARASFLNFSSVYAVRQQIYGG